MAFPRLLVAGLVGFVGCALTGSCVTYTDRMGSGGSASDDDDGGPTGGDDDTADDDAEDDDTTPEETDGYLWVYYRRVDHEFGDPYVSAGFGARFWEEISPWVSGVDWQQPDEQNTCALTLFTWAEYEGGDDGEYHYQSAGNLTIDGPQGTNIVPPYTGSPSGMYYWHDFMDHPELALGATYDVYAPGDEFPGFDMSQAIEVPLARVYRPPSEKACSHG